MCSLPTDVFPKDNAEWLNWINQGKALYLNKEKIQNLIGQQRTNLADVDYLDLDSITKVIESFENPTIQDGILFREKELDEEYNSLVGIHNISAENSVYGVEGNAATVSGFSLAWQSGVCVKLFPGAVCFSAKVIVLWKRMFLNGCVLLRACCVVL